MHMRIDRDNTLVLRVMTSDWTSGLTGSERMDAYLMPGSGSYRPKADDRVSNLIALPATLLRLSSVSARFRKGSHWSSMKKLIIGALLALLLGAWYVGTDDRQVLIVSNRSCPCDLETFTDKAWDSVCLVPPYIPYSIYSERAGNRQPVTLDQDNEWALAYYFGDKLVDLLYADSTQIPLERERLTCQPRSSARYAFGEKGFFLIEKE